MYLKWSEQSVVNFFEFWVELDRPHLIKNVNELEEVEQRETDVPCEHIGSADDAPRPHWEQHEPCNTWHFVTLTLFSDLGFPPEQRLQQHDASCLRPTVKYYIINNIINFSPNTNLLLDVELSCYILLLTTWQKVLGLYSREVYKVKTPFPRKAEITEMVAIDNGYWSPKDFITLLLVFTAESENVY